MVMSTPNWVKSIGLTLYEEPLHDKADDLDWEDGKKIFTMGRMDGATKKWYQWSNIGSPEQVLELDLIPLYDAEEGNDLTISTIKWGYGFQISKELEEDNRNLKGLLGNMAEGVRGGFQYAKSMCMASIFNNSSSATAPYAGLDTLALISDSHSTMSGTTIDNSYGTTSFGWDAIWDMTRYFDYGLYAENGLPMKGKGKYILLHPKKKELWKAIFTSPGKWDEADRMANTLAGEFEPIWCRLLSNTDDYYMLDEKAKNDLIFDMRRDLTVEWDDSKQNDARMCFNTARWGYGHIGYKRVYGSVGH